MERIKLIRPADRSFAEKAQEHWDSVAKPLGSFGALEEMWDRIAAVQRTVTPDISRRAVVVMCGDNGVTAEGVTQTDSSVTLACGSAIACGRSNINALAAVYNAKVLAERREQAGRDSEDERIHESVRDRQPHPSSC